MTVQPPPPDVPVYAGYVVPPPMRPTSGMATAAFVLALVGIFLGWCLFGAPSIIAVALGHWAMRETSSGERGGHGMAVTALILGYPFAILWVLFFVMGGIGTIAGLGQ